MKLPLIRFRLAARGIIGLGIVVALGCNNSDGRPNRTQVSGTVTFRGQKVAEADIIFSPANGNAAYGKTDESGKYQLSTFGENDGAIPGSYKVMISKKVITNGMTAEESRNYFAQHGTPPPEPVYEYLVPMKYGDINTPLTATVGASESGPIDFNMTD